MHRFFVEPAAISGDLAVLTGPEARHLRAVLRLTPGEAITLFDGRGTIYEASIKQVGKNQVVCAILAAHTAKQTGPTLHLGQALLLGKKMDLVVQKATELGGDPSIHGRALHRRGWQQRPACPLATYRL